MSTTAPLSLVSDNLSALGLNADTLYFALNYEFDAVPSKGLLARFKEDQGNMDLDIACVLYDANCTISDLVWFKQLRDKAESVCHQGDSLTGKDRGEQALYRAPLDQEQIRLYLADIPVNIRHLALLASSYHGQPFHTVKAGEVHLSDDEGNHAFDVNLKQLPTDCKAVWVASLHREVDDWYLTVHNLPLSDKDLSKAAQEVAHELARALPTS